MKVVREESLLQRRIAAAKMISLDWFATYNKQIIAAICAIITVSFFLLPLMRLTNRGRLDYLQIQNAFTNWDSQTKHDPALFKPLRDSLARNPELSTKFGTSIAQRLLSLGEIKLADEYAQAALKRTKTLLSPYHIHFSQNTLLISQGQMKRALELAYQLKKTMEEDELLWKDKEYSLQAGRTLYAYNLLRIASLEREIGSKQRENAAWDEILRSAGWAGAAPHPKTHDPLAFKAIAENYQVGEVSLLDYIQQRKREINLSDGES